MRERAQRFSRLTLVSVLALTFGAGCRTSSEDIKRWGNTAQGPRKLVSVVTHDKYPKELRVEATLTLVSMKPRSGQRVGIDQMVEALTALPGAERTQVVSGMVPKLVSEIVKPPPASAEEPDSTIPYKDAAYALLTNDGEVLVESPEEQLALKDALSKWAITAFARRMDDSTQKYGMAQVLRYLGPKGVAGLPELIAPEAKKIDQIADLISDIGDDATRLAASKRLAEVAREVNSDAWLKRKMPELQEANKASGIQVDEKRFQLQLAQYQEEELLRIFASMKKVGKEPVIEYLVEFASNKANPVKRRAAALAALEGHVDKKDDKQGKKLIELAGAQDTPDEVRDQALRRVGELPRKQVISDLYKLFRNDNWKIRWLAAELVLKMSETPQLDEFMRELGDARGLALTEPLRYGAIIAGLKGPDKVATLVDKYLPSENPVPVRLAALGYYYDQGAKSDLPKVMQYATDPARIPVCKPDAKDCEWKCTVSEGGKQEQKDVATVGDFVQSCVKPALEARSAPAAGDSSAKNEDKSPEKQ